ncbi:MAG TPA: DnaT-like ssDNA-binding protein [Nitrospira sp.]|nr:DnaT-like ssDNA-binding protein [Nitrospira sp.]
MAFTVEDGTGLATANSFCDVPTADAYFTDRNTASNPLAAAWLALAIGDKQALLIEATDYINVRFNGKFLGQPVNPGVQALEWARFLDPTITTLPQPLPACLQKATCEYAIRAKAGPLAPDPVTDPSGYQVVRSLRRVASIQKETEFAVKGPGSIPQYLKPYPAADMLLRPILLPSYGRVIRN